MNGKGTTKDQLIQELEAPQRRIVEMDQSETEGKWAAKNLRSSEQYLDSILNGITDAVFTISPDFKILWANKVALEQAGKRLEEIIGQYCFFITHHNLEPCSSENETCPVEQVIRTSSPAKAIHKHFDNLGNEIFVEMVVYPLKDKEGRITQYVHVSHDISESKQLEIQLAHKTLLLETQLETSIDGILVVDTEGRVILYNERFGELLSVPQDELEKKDGNQILKHVLKLSKNPEEFLDKVRYLYRNREEKSKDEIELINGRFLERYSSPMINTKGEHYGRIWNFRDITERKQAEEALKESEERYRTAIEQSNDGIALVKGDRHIFVNQKMIEIFGYNRPDEIVGRPLSMLIHPDDQERVMDVNLRRQKGEAVSRKYEFKGQRKNGEPLYIEVSATKTTYQGEVVSLAYLRDITDRKRAEEALKTLSLKDDLTGLYNRRGFFTLAEQGLKTAQRMGTKMLLIFGDLDNFKEINDTFGHKEGDQALVDISQILNETLRESDIIARIGGDEFVILAMNSVETSAEKLINRLDHVLKDHPLQTKRPYTLSLSLGIAYFDPKNPCSTDGLLTQADKIMYENKQKKKRLG